MLPQTLQSYMHAQKKGQFSEAALIILTFLCLREEASHLPFLSSLQVRKDAVRTLALLVWKITELCTKFLMLKEN